MQKQNAKLPPLIQTPLIPFNPCALIPRVWSNAANDARYEVERSAT